MPKEKEKPSSGELASSMPELLGKAFSWLADAGKELGRGATLDALGGPVDLLNALLSLTLLETSPEPVGGSKWLRGKLSQPKEPETLAGEVGNAASMLLPGKATLSAAEALPMLLGSVFIGQKSPAFSREAGKALEELETRAGKDFTPEMQKEFYGVSDRVFRHPADAMLRQEIPSKDARLDMRPVYSKGSAPLEEILGFDKLFEAYPDLRWLKVGLEEGKGASYNPKGDFIDLGRESRDPLESLIHEIQHAVQRREGFPRGGAPTEFKPGMRVFDNLRNEPEFATKANDEIAQILYRRLGGEAEARNAQLRHFLSRIHTQEELDKLMPFFDITDRGTLDLAPEKHILKTWREWDWE